MAQRVRIAVDARSLLCRAPRGEGKSLLRLYEELTSSRPDLEPLFFGDASTAQYTGPLPSSRPGISLHLPGIVAHWETLAFPLAARLHGCRVMHCTSSGSPPWCGGLPMILTVHDLIPLMFDDGHAQAERESFAKRLKQGVRQASRVFVVSNYTRDDLLRTCPEATEKTSVMYWGAMAPSARVQPAAAPRHLLAFGGEVNRKNTDYTLARFVAVAREVPDVHLHMVGLSSNAQRRRLEAWLTEAGLASRVTLHPFITETELDRLFASATALLYLSLYEGFGVPLLEAVSKGVPVIASDRTAIPEVLRGVAGCFPLGKPEAIEKALIALLDDSSKRDALAQEQSGVLARFQWSDAASQLATAIDQALL